MPISIDGNDVTDLTIDGTDVTEVTVDGDVVWPSGPRFYSFEDQNTNGWDVTKSHSITSSKSTDGSYSYSNDADLNYGYFLANTSLSGEKPDEIVFDYYETDSSGGMAYMPKDTNGDLILAAGTGNTQVNVEYGDYNTWDPGSGDYNTWNRYTIEFDWSNQTFDVAWDHLNSGDSFGERDLPFMNKNGGGISEIGVGYHNFAGAAKGNPKGHEWVDRIWGGIK